MSHLTSFEAIGFERGRAIGLRLSIAAILRVRFGMESAASLMEEIQPISDSAMLERILVQAETAPTLEAIRQVYAAP
jgi:hypothetical protein